MTATLNGTTYTGTLSERQAPGLALTGFRYVTTDTGYRYYCNGVDWLEEADGLNDAEEIPGRKAAYVNPASGTFAASLIASLVAAGIMDAAPTA